MLLRLRDITLQVNGAPAFPHTHWEIRRGEHWAILGATGAGKTLLAAAINRRVPLVHGEIEFFFDPQPGAAGRPYLYPGEVLTLSAESHRSFLARYSSYHQARWQSLEGDDVPRVRELFEGVSGGRAEDREEIVRLLRIQGLLERKVLHLSHGESRKVHLAFLLLQQPWLLILDDPYVGLDAQSRNLLARAIEGLLERNAPQVLLISSRGEEIPDGVHQLLLVEGLQVMASGSREEVLARHLPAALGAPEREGPVPANPVFDRVISQFAAALARDQPAIPEMVRMEAVSVSYGPVNVLQDITWRVRRGERWSLCGPNGAGKTTLLSLILADNPRAYANEIFLFGRRRGTGESIWEIKRHIGWVSPELHIHYPQAANCLDVVNSGFYDSVGLFRHCTPQQNAAAQEWLDAFGMGELAKSGFQTLSSGQQRLVLLARALVKDPPLLILDEPCQGLDAPHRREFTARIDQICARTSLTVVYVTHYPDELPGSISHQLRLDAGRAVQCGPLERE